MAFADAALIFVSGTGPIVVNQTPTTLGTASTFSVPLNSAALDFITAPGTPRSGLAARFHNIQGIASTASATFQFQVQLSSDSVTWETVGLLPIPPYTLGTTLSTFNEVHIPFSMVTGQEYVRVNMSMPAGSSGAPLISFASEVELEWP